MNKRRLLVSSAALLLAGCSRAPYTYVALAGDNVEVRESGDPPQSLWRIGGSAIPVRYVINEPGVSLTLAVGPESFVPSFDIASSAPIRSVSASPAGEAIRRSQEGFRVLWSDAPVGSSVQIKIEIDHRDDPIVVAGVIAQSGTIFYSDL